MRKQNEKHFNQCINILDSVQNYQEERKQEKSQRTILLDDLGSQSLYTGLPELAQKKLEREVIREGSCDSPQKLKREASIRLLKQVKIYKVNRENTTGR